MTSCAYFALKSKSRRTPYLILAGWMRELKIARLLRLRLLSGPDVSSGYWLSAYILRRLRSEDFSRSSLHAFGGLLQIESARVRSGLGPSRRQRRRQGMSDFEPAQKIGKDSKGDLPVGKP
ncbi:unnamed protein product [Peronospora farinosa]|uniref:Uncharacterized protein n=1 Tax=Peronospora farinosa TaxID=134698 RepID=A0ABN8C9E0_9STRA|nr:unnamed protein product [Peronospora farinosa]